MSSSLPRILVVDDDRELLFLIRVALEREGYRVIEAADGKTGLELTFSEKPDLIVLDVDMPALNGLDVCKELRRLYVETPILMLTGRGLLNDKINGFNAGADDYLGKPFEPREFLARVHALVRRHRRTAERPAVLRLGDTMIDLEHKTATRANEPFTLTKTEFAILELLAKTPGVPVSRQTLLDVVWGYTRFPTTRTVDTHIWRLRKKLGDTGDEPRWIRLSHRQGYALMVEPTAST